MQTLHLAHFGVWKDKDQAHNEAAAMDAIRAAEAWGCQLLIPRNLSYFDETITNGHYVGERCIMCGRVL